MHENCVTGSAARFEPRLPNPLPSLWLVRTDSPAYRLSTFPSLTSLACNLGGVSDTPEMTPTPNTVCAPVVLLASVMLAPPAAFAQPTLYQGDAAIEAAWRAAAAPGGTVPLENFDNYVGTPAPCSSRSDAVIALPALGVTLRGLTPGSHPGAYTDANFAHSGLIQLSNFGYDIPCVNAVDYFIEAEPGLAIYAAGVWQCDPQGNLTVVAEDAGGNAMFSFVALINNHSGNSFGGFVSTAAVARLRVLGAEGDGWNHLDDLQIVTRAPLCAADFNQDGFVNPDDLSDFITCFFLDVQFPGNCPASDFNQDGFRNPDDLSDFIAAFFAGC
jgi:hypothetical protein